MLRSRRAWSLGLALGVTIALLPAVANIPAQAGTVSVSLAVRTPTVFAGESLRARLSIAGASATCSVQAARGTSTQWRTVRSVTLRAGRGVDIVAATTGWRLGTWRLRATCASVRAVQSLSIVAPPPWSAATVTVPGLTPAFDADIADYVVRQPDGEATCDLSMSASAPNGLRIGLDGRTPITGASAAAVDLSPGQATRIRLLRGGIERVASVRCLPNDFPLMTATGTGTAEWYALDYLLGTDRGDYGIVVDRHGTPVWWYRDTDGRPTTLRMWTPAELQAFGIDLPYAVSAFSGPDTVFTGLDGTQLILPWNTDRHDLQPSGDGTVYVIKQIRRRCGTDPSECVDMSAYGGSTQATMIDEQIVELDRNGNVVWSWNTRDHIPLSWTGHWLTDRYGAQNDDGTWDIIHANAVEPDGDAVLVSIRNTDSIIKIDKATGDIVWKLGGTPAAMSLAVTDTQGLSIPGRVLSGQHDVRLLADGTITAFDNGTLTWRKARAVRFSIDESRGKATLLESVSDPALTQGSACCGSARRLPNGHWVVSWGASARVSELDESGTAVFSIVGVAPKSTYRIVPTLPGVIPGEALRNGMDVMHPRT